MVNAQEYLNQKYPTKEGRNNLTKLDISNQNLEGDLNLSDFTNLEGLNLEENKITNLNLNVLNELIFLNCKNNSLTNLNFLNSLNPQKLQILILNNNNFPPQDLEIFASFQELTYLCIGGTEKNKFTGSLKPLRNLNKLKVIDINGTDISHGLEFLPESVKAISCFTKSGAKVNDIYEELQPFEKIKVEIDGQTQDDGGLKKWREAKLDKKQQLTMSHLTPPQLSSEFKKENKFIVKSKLIESKLIKAVNYDKIHFNLWNKSEPLLPKEVPLRLYNIKGDKIEEAKDIKEPYAILSYVWGKNNKLAKEDKYDTNNWDTIHKEKLNLLGYKSLYKAVQSLKNTDLNINYLWIDQLCMNQEDQHEKSLEVPKMGKYYDNASLTLINMNAELGDLSNIDLVDALKLIINSKWFARSWTFQEGWLSKWTVFMFDDYLIDGRAMAGTWALNQLSYVDGGKYNSRGEFDRGTKKIATPVGWVYYRDGYDSDKDKIELTLTQALKAIKNRKRTEPVDGIYSILGLLPYGKDVKVRYKVKKCQCEDKKNCSHLEVDNNPQDALKEVMKVAIDNGYAEPLAWHGVSNKTPNLCWMPQIDENGSTNVVGSAGKIDNEKMLTTLTEQGIRLINIHYIICQDYQNTHKLEGGFEIEGGLYRKDVKVKIKDTQQEPIKISLLGTKETLELTQENNILTVIYKEIFGTNKLFALLLKETNQENVYHRLGLIELADDKIGLGETINFAEKEKAVEKETIIGSDIEVWEYQSHIEQPPKT